MSKEGGIVVQPHKVWKWMTEGQEFVIDGYTYVACWDEEDEQYVLAIKCSLYENGNLEKETRTFYSRVPMSMGDFDNLCKKIDKDDYFIIGCQAAMADMSREKQEKREEFHRARKEKEECNEQLSGRND